MVHGKQNRRERERKGDFFGKKPKENTWMHAEDGRMHVRENKDASQTGCQPALTG